MLRRRIAHKALGNPAFAAQQRGLAIWTGSEAPAKRHYDILVVGSGGGAKVATPAAKLGFKVGVLEHGFDAFGRHLNGLGGTCLNRGCIPSKMLIHAAEVAQEVKDAHRFSVQAQFQGVDLEELVTRVEKEVDGDSASIEKGYASDPLRDWYKSTGRFIGERTMQIGTAEVSADRVFVAAGCVPRIPDIPGLAGTPFLTSTEALRLKTLPKRLCLIGGGYIALELGHYFGALGSEVTTLARSQLLRGVDGETRAEFARQWKQRYPRSFEHVRFDRVRYDASSRTFSVDLAAPEPGVAGDAKAGKGTLRQQTVVVDQLLVAAGVRPATRDLQCERAGIKLDSEGLVAVDDALRTSARNVWAFGDVTGRNLFRHAANFEGEYLLETVVYPLHEAKQRSAQSQSQSQASGQSSTQQQGSEAAAPSYEWSAFPTLTGLDGRAVSEPRSENAGFSPAAQPALDFGGGPQARAPVPWAVFATPQVAGVGETEEQLQARSAKYVKGVNRYINSAMGSALRSEGGHVKLLIERGSRRILGCHIVGTHASTLLHEVTPLIRLGGRLDEILYSIHVHPALNEILRNAARKAKQALMDAGEPIPLRLSLK